MDDPLAQAVLIVGVNPYGVPVASVQETSIRASTGNAVEENEGYYPRLSWAKLADFLIV